MMTKRFLATLFGLLLAAPAWSGGSATEWFERMRQAMQEQDFEGRFVYQVGDRLQSMYVVHRVSSGGIELERLVSLNGESKEVIRGDKAVACLNPGKHLVSVIEAAWGDGVPAEETDLPIERLLQHYEFRFVGAHRVAGRAARQIEVMPKDDLRFGYRLSLDRETALPLHSMVMDSQQRLVSQLMFVELKTGAEVTTIERDLTALQVTEQPQLMAPMVQRPVDRLEWRFEGLPAGYRLVSVREEPARERQHLIFSDGISAFSLYVEALDGAPLNGYSQAGAARLYAEPRFGRQITAVGEVPQAALRMAVNAIRTP